MFISCHPKKSREMSSLTALNDSTIRLLGSTQVITSVFSVVKELIENALDAEATTVDIRLENYGLDKVEVRDNGTGIPTVNVPFVAKRYHTSKISSFSDICSVETYGFRGEALGSLCTVSTLSITTKTADGDVSLTYIFNNQGQITSSNPSHLTQGTTITAINLFKNLPVRRQFYNTNKKKKDELKRIEDILISFSIILPNVRFTLTHDKEKVWQKNVVSDTRAALLGVFGRSVLNNLVHKSIEIEDPKIKLEIFLPNPKGDSMVTSKTDNCRCICAINNRPVNIKYIEKLIRQYYSSCLRTDNHRHPIYFLSITVATDQLDINVEPNKTVVLLHHKNEVLKVLTSVLEDLYGSLSKEPDDKAKNNSCDTEAQKGENSSDDSFTITPVKQTESDIPIFKINTTDVPRNQSLNCDNEIDIDKKLIGQVSKNPQTSSVVTKSTTEAEQDVPPLTQLGKPVFQIIEDSLDDLLSDTFHEERGLNGTSVEKTSKDRNNVSETTSTNDKLVPNGINKINHSKSSTAFNFQENSQISKLYNDITSTWKDTQNITVTLANQNQDGLDLTNQNASETTISLSTDSFLSGTKEQNSRAECDFEQNKLIVPPARDDWCKGQSVNQDGKILQPVTVLHGKRLLSAAENEELPIKKRQTEGQTKITEVMSSQAAINPETAFIAYSKEKRSKVVADNPRADYDMITSILETSWESLPDEDKERYFVKTSPVTPKSKKVSSGGSEKKEKKLGKGMKLFDKRTSQTWTSIKDQLMKQKLSAGPQKVKNVNFSIQDLKTTFSQKLFPSQTQKSMLNLIGPLKTSGVWVGCHENSIRIVNPHRIQETVLYHNLMANHIVESQKLEQPLQLTESSFGESLWTTLKSLADKTSSTGTYNVLQDKRLTANGIEITFHKEDDSFSAKLTGLCRCIPVYGIADVKEILQLISTTRAITVSEARPLKVLNYLKGEAVRMARKLPRQQSKDDMVDLLIQMETVLPGKCDTCLHNKPFYHTLYSLDNIPLTQSQV